MIVAKRLQGWSLAEGHALRVPLAKGVAWGLIAGLTGTMVMDFLLMGALLAVRYPPLLCFSIVGDTVARFFSILGLGLTAGIPTGIAAHYLIGPLVGAVFGAVVTQALTLRVDTFKKCVIFAVIYVEIVSQPILATTPILLKMTAPEVLQWYVGSFVMHLILAVVLGTVLSYGLRLAPLVAKRSVQ